MAQPSNKPLAGRRALVVGASSGIGRAVALAISAAGARVAFAARRTDLLEQAVKEAENDAVALTCDVRDPDACTMVVEDAVAALGGLDVLVYGSGVTPIRKLVDADVEVWRTVIETNLIGAALVTRAAVPHLSAASGRAVYLSSISASVTPPWPGVSVYAVSKAGLDKLVDSWRSEHPEIAFTRIAIGPTITEIADSDIDSLMEFTPMWIQRGLMTGAAMVPEKVAEQVVGIIATSERIWHLTIQPH